MSVQLHSVEKELKSTGLTTLLQRKVFAYHYTDTKPAEANILLVPTVVQTRGSSVKEVYSPIA